MISERYKTVANMCTMSDSSLDYGNPPQRISCLVPGHMEMISAGGCHQAKKESPGRMQFDATSGVNSVTCPLGFLLTNHDLSK